MESVHEELDGNVHFQVEAVDAGQQRTRHIDQTAAGGGAHDLGFHLFGVENVDVAQQIGQRGHQAVTAPVGAGRGDDAVRRALRQNAALAAEGKPVKQTKFETDKAKLRQTIRNAMSEATTFDEFSALLLRQGVIVKESRGRLSYLTPDRTKPITARKLGDDFDRAAVLALLEQNAHRAAEKTAPIPEYHTAETNRTERGKTQKIAPTGNIQRMVDRAAKRAEGKGIGYDRWAAVHNLKQMAATVAAMEQYGFTPDELDAALVSANADLHSSTAKLKPIETAIREKKDLQKQVLAYAKTRDVRDGLKKQKTDKARKAYREKHESDFIIADAAVRYFRQKGITKLPTYKSLQAEIEQLTAEKNALYNEYRANKERVRELQTMKSNLSQMHHGEPSRQKKHEQER